MSIWSEARFGILVAAILLAGSGQHDACLFGSVVFTALTAKELFWPARQESRR